MTFAPSWQRYRVYLMALLPAILVLLVLDFVRDRRDAPVHALILAGVLALMAVYFVLYFRNYRIIGEFKYLELRNWAGAARTLGPDQLERVVVVNSYSDNGVTVPYLMVLDRRGKRILSMSGRFWSLEQMTQLAEALTVPTDHLDAQRPIDLRSRYPRAISFVSAYPYRSGLLLAVVVVAAVAIGVFIFDAATYQWNQ